MVVKECKASPLRLDTAVTSVPCNPGVAWQHVPPTRRLRALAHCFMVGSSPSSPPCWAWSIGHPPPPPPENSQLWSEIVCHHAPPSPVDPTTLPLALCTRKTGGARPAYTVQEDGSPFPRHTQAWWCLLPSQSIDTTPKVFDHWPVDCIFWCKILFFLRFFENLLKICSVPPSSYPFLNYFTPDHLFIHACDLPTTVFRATLDVCCLFLVLLGTSLFTFFTTMDVCC